MADVFVSYATEDRERVAPLVRVLEAEGWSVWWDRNIRPGAHFQRAISDAIDDAHCVVVCWTTTSVNSDWVLNEADDGKERGILVPVLLDDVRPPMGFRMTQLADLRHWDAKSSTPEVDAFVAAVGTCLGRSRARAPTRPRPIPRRGTSWLRNAMLAVGLIVTIAIAFTLRGRLPGFESESNGQNCVAVLPFEVISATPGQDWIGESLATEFHTKLRELYPDLCVSGRATSFNYRGKALDNLEVGRQLGVDFLIQGAVQLSGVTIRVTSELITVASGYQKGDSLVERNLEKGFAAQIDIAAVAVPVLAAALDQSQGPTLRLSGIPSANATAPDSAMQRLIEQPQAHAFDSFGTEADE